MTSFETLFTAVKSLDEKVNQKRTIVAVGGFALMYAAFCSKIDVRASHDVDDINDLEYDDGTKKVIEDIANRLHLRSDWLNTESAPYYMNEDGLIIDEKECEEIFKGNKITLKVLNIIQQLRGKLDSISANGIGYRQNDEDDVLTILNIIGVNSYESLMSHPECGFVFTEYDETILQFIKETCKKL
ncbi:MAG: hypothetical protein FWH05_05235 [Oscillospiraceae bacterium]|nr:hypothetical protein [Oscillospiraceae bacterium]